MSRSLSSRIIVCMVASLLVATVASAAPLDVPTMSLVRSSQTSMVIEVQAGPSGAPGGFWIEWMTRADYELEGGWTGNVVYCSMTGVPTLNTDGSFDDFILAPGEAVTLEVGDFFDETGLWATYRGELDPGTEYVYRIFANAGGGDTASPYSGDIYLSSDVEAATDCTYTQGYWKNHTSAWPVTSLTLGSATYSAAQLLAIFNTPAQGNGLIFLAHQLIAAKLNAANGATITPAVQASMDQADLLIGVLVVPSVGGGHLSPSSASALTESLDQYNNGYLGVGHCDAVPAQVTSWGALKTAGN